MVTAMVTKLAVNATSLDIPAGDDDAEEDDDDDDE